MQVFNIACTEDMIDIMIKQTIIDKQKLLQKCEIMNTKIIDLKLKKENHSLAKLKLSNENIFNNIRI